MCRRNVSCCCCVFSSPTACFTAGECRPDNIKAFRPLNRGQVAFGSRFKESYLQQTQALTLSLTFLPLGAATYFTVIVFWCSCKHLCNPSSEHLALNKWSNTNRVLSLPININLHNNNNSTVAPKLCQTDLITDSFYLFFLHESLTAPEGYVFIFKCGRWKYKKKKHRKMIPSPLDGQISFFPPSPSP